MTCHILQLIPENYAGLTYVHLRNKGSIQSP